MTRKLAIASVAAAVLLGSAVGWLIALNGHQAKGVASQTTMMLGGHRPKVGPGWFLAAYVDRPAHGAATSKLEFVSPDGSSYPAYSTPGDFAPIAWSGDGRRVLLFGTPRITSDTVTEVVDLDSGRATPVAVPAGPNDTQVIGFTRPDGLALLTMTYTRSGGVLQRRTLTGTHPVTLATKVAAGAVVSTADGQALLVNQDHEVQLISNRGMGATTVVPSSANCAPVRLWSATELLAQCGGAMVNAAGSGRLERLPLTGGVTQVVARDTSDPLAVNTDAYLARGRIYTATSGACGSGWISRVAPNGTISRLATPQSPPYAYTLLTSNGTDLAVIKSPGDCTDAEVSLVWMNPETRALRTIFSVPKGHSAGFLPFATATTAGRGSL